MTKPANETRHFKPAPCTRAGLTDRVRRVFHPKRGNHPLRVLAAEGEDVEVRPEESHHWARLLRSGDVTEGKGSSSSSKTSRKKAAKDVTDNG